MSDAGSGSGGTFFGLIVKPNKRYDTVVKEAFRVTKACLEPATAGGKVTSLYLEYDSEEFIIANLNDKTFNENLDLGFSLGEKISFKVDGPGTVHVTGNIVEEDMPSFMEPMSDESEDEQDEEMETPDSASGKRKSGDMKKAAKRMKLDSSNGKADDEESSDEDDDDDEDSSDEAETGAETTTLSDLDSTNNFAEEEDSDEESESGEEEEEESEDDSSDEDSEEEEEEKTKPAPKTNGDVSPSKKLKPEPKTPKQGEKPKENGKTPKQEGKTPKAEKPANVEKTPKTAKPEEASKTPKAAKTPKPDEKAKTPKAAKTPKPEESVKTPKAAKTPKPDETAKTPKSTNADENAKTPKAAKTPKSDANAAATPKSAKKALKGGIQMEEVKVGTGPEVKPGRTIGMYYSGRLQTNNKQFDACQSGKPFKFRLGAGEVIKGWDIGIMGMKVGGKRKLTLPPNMAYGARGCPPDIPPNSTLVFDIECKFVN